MSYHQPDPSNAPALSVLQQFDIFKGKGGKREDFALQTAKTADKIFAIATLPINEGATLPINEGLVTFWGGMLRFDRDAQAAWIMMGKISRTQQILAGNRESVLPLEPDPNLGIHYIGNC